MANRKKIRTRGKISLSRYFQEFKQGDKVAVSIEPSIKNAIPKRMQGRTGNVESKRGKAYVVTIKDHDKEKTFIIPPIHLKKIKQI